jgi:polynucleotide 5'-kinase involved in rRNA processing
MSPFMLYAVIKAAMADPVPPPRFTREERRQWRAERWRRRIEGAQRTSLTQEDLRDLAVLGLLGAALVVLFVIAH